MDANIGAAHRSLGRPQILTPIYTIIAGTFLTLLIILAPNFRLAGAAQASLLAGLANIPVQIFMMKRTLGITFGDVARLYYRPLTASIGTFAAVKFCVNSFDHSSAQIALMITCVFFGALVYVIVDLLLWYLAGKPSWPEAYFVDQLNRRINKN